MNGFPSIVRLRTRFGLAALLTTLSLSPANVAAATAPPPEAQEISDTAENIDAAESALRTRIQALLTRVRNQGSSGTGGTGRPPVDWKPIDPNILLPGDGTGGKIPGKDPGNIDPIRIPGDPTKVDPVTTPPIDLKKTPPAKTDPGKIDLGKTTPIDPVKTQPPAATGRVATFAATDLALPEYGYSAGGWRVEKNPRLIGDVNGDGRADVVGFGNGGTYVTLAAAPSRAPKAGVKGMAAPTPFAATAQALPDYGFGGGWRVEKHVRVLGDVNGDGKDDLVAFHDDQTYLSLSTGTGFAKPKACGTGLGYNAGWRVDAHPRVLADVNGDGKADIVGFGADGTYVALSTGGGFARPAMILPAFGTKQGWDAAEHERVMADVNGDRKADIVGFGPDGTWVAVSAGATFGRPALAVKSFGTKQGWHPGTNARLVGDVNGDGKADLVGCGTSRTYVYLSTGRGFSEAESLPFFDTNAGWQAAKHPRVLADVDGDGKADLIGFGGSKTFVALANGKGFDAAAEIFEDFSYAKGWRIEKHPRFVADFDGDGKADVLGFGNSGTYLAPAR